jgi:hypothetical protein
MDGSDGTINLVREFLDANDYGYTVTSDGHCVRIGFQGDHGAFTVLIALQEAPTRLGVFVRIPTVVPEDRRREVAEGIVRANYGLPLGGFDMDMSDGVMTYRASMPIADGTITQEQFEDLLFASLLGADRYFQAFNRLLYGDDLSPAEAIAEVEMADS